MTDKRVLYVAFGMPYVVLALNSIKSLRKHNPNMPVTVVTNVLTNAPAVPFWTDADKWIRLDDKESSNRNIKTSISSFTTTEKNLFLDCDTIVTGPLDSGFELLNYFDIAIKPHSEPKWNGDKSKHSLFSGKKTVRDLPHWNSGVIFFNKNERVEAFFDTWKRKCAESSSPYDQVSLVEAIFISDVRIGPLDSRWNCTKAGFEYSVYKDDIIIVHYTSDIDKALDKDIMDMSRMIEATASKELSHNMYAFLSERRKGRLQRGKRLTGSQGLKVKIYHNLRRILAGRM